MKEKIQNLIANGKLAEALKLFAPYNQDVIILQARLTKLEREKRLGLLKHGTYNRGVNQITYGLLSMLEEMEFDEIPANAQPPLPAPNKTPAQNDTFQKSVFVSYAPEDRDLQKRLRVHLSPLRRSDKINDWSDEELLPGSQLNEEIKKRLHRADIILLLVSPDFLASDDIWDTDIKIAMERHGRSETMVVPIIIRPCQWQDMPFGKLRELPGGAGAVTEWPDPDQAFLKIVEGISRLL